VERVPREEFLRFALLIVLTMALASVAFRIDSHPASHPASQRSGAPMHRASPPTSGSPQVLPTSATRAPGSSPSSGAGPSGAGRSGAGPAGPPSGSSVEGQPILPVTGWDGAVRLAALAVVLIGGGMSLRIAARSPRRP